MKDRSTHSSSPSSAKSDSGGKDKSSRQILESKDGTQYDGLLPGPEVGVLLIDEKRKIVTANDVSAAIFGTCELSGKDVSVLLKGGLQNEFGRVFQQKFLPGKATQRFSFNVNALCKGGPSVPVSVILTRNAVSNKTWWTALFRKLEGEEQTHSPNEILQGATDELQKHCLSMMEESSSYRTELESLQKERDELVGKVEAAQTTVGELEGKMAEQVIRYQKLEKSHTETKKELENARSGTAIKEREFENGLAQNERLKEELVALRQMCDDLTEKLTAEQLGSADKIRLAEDLEQQFEKASKAEVERQAKLDAAIQAVEELKTEREEEEQNAREMAAELEGFRQTLQELEGKRVQEQQVVEKATQRQQELESELQASTEELEKAREELAALNQEGNQEEWAQDLRRLRAAEASYDGERSDLEHRVREGVASLARATADLDRERKERRRIEQRSSSLTSQLQEMHEELKRHLESERTAQDKIFGLEEQLREQEESVGRLKLELQEVEAGQQLAEEQLNLAGDMKTQVDNYRTLFEESKDTFKKSREELESKLQSSLLSLNDAENKLRHEVGERQRLQESLASVQERYERNALELSKLQSELQVERLERKQMEGDATHSRYATLDSARVNRAQTSTLKRQLRQPVDALLHFSRVLLDADLNEDQKKVVESLLENTFLVQACLQESALSSGSAASPAVDTQEEPAASPNEGGETGSGEVPQAA